MESNRVSSERIHIAKSADESATACAKFVLEALSGALQQRQTASFAISGGNTPKPMFKDLAESGFDWEKVHVFWVDERCVPPHDDQSNFKLANEIWLTPAGVPPANVHRIYGELTPDEAALKYLTEIESFFRLTSGELPELDLIHRGMGPDAHTASLFPGEPLIDNETGIAAAVWVEKMKSHRVTLLPGVLRKARQTVLQVAGDAKAEPARQVLNGPVDLKKFPCQIAVRDSDRAHWFLDQAAARNL